MRSDMAKVICESPRHNSRYDYTEHHALRAAKRFTVELGEDGYDVNDKFSGRRKFGKAKRFGSGTKSFGEHLAPLYRLLDGKVGKNWNTVYKEICENLNPKSTLHQHILLHVDQYVEQNTFIGEDGKVWYRTWREVQPINQMIGGLWVHPVSRMIHRSKWASYETYNKSRGKPRTINTIRAGSNTGFYWNEGVWFRMTYVDLNRTEWINDCKENGLYKYGVVAVLPSTYSTEDKISDANGVTGYIPGNKQLNYRSDIRKNAIDKYGIPILIIRFSSANSDEIKKHKLLSYRK